MSNPEDMMGPEASTSEGKPSEEGVASVESKGESKEATPTHKHCTKKWSETVEKIRAPVVRALIVISNHAATHPVKCVSGILFFSIAIFIIGAITNMTLETDVMELWPPFNSRAMQHWEWIDEESGFDSEGSRGIWLIVHAEGQNVLEKEAKEGARRVFEAIDTIRNNPGYLNVCPQPDSEDCDIEGITRFWNDTRTAFDSVKTNDEVIRQLSAVHYPEGERVYRKAIFGNADPQIPTDDEDIDAEDVLLKYVESYFVGVQLPDNDEGDKFEKDAADALLDLRDAWKEDGGAFRLEVSPSDGFGDEFMRAVMKDMPLLGAAFIVMSMYSALVFSRKNKVQSQSLVGFGAVVNILLALLTSYGLMFICGVPMTNLTQIFPFIMFGIGLDDAFIIEGAYRRTDSNKDVTQRIEDAMRDIGASITLTTLTTFIAFTLLCTSQIPAVFWFALYAFPCVFIDFAYQVTFFIALIAIDERRRQQGRIDCCVCFNARESEQENEEDTKRFAERVMTTYSDLLLTRRVKALVIVIFLALFATFIYSTSQLTQYFYYIDMVPGDSYLRDFDEAYQEYSEFDPVAPGIFFRFVDVSQPEIQNAMFDYVAQLVQTEWISEEPPFFWLRDFNQFIDGNTALENNTFNQNVTAFLEQDEYKSLYADAIVRNANNDVIESTTYVVADGVDPFKVKSQTGFLNEQRDLTANLPINEGQDDWPFFTFYGEFPIYDFYDVCVRELTASTVWGVVAVTLVSMFGIPHWSAACFVAPLVAMVYIGILGIMQFADLHINAVTYVGLIMCIGLMVDYLMHVVIKYFESEANGRDLKVKDVLQTMGASIIIGGTSTVLGVIPLAFSTSEIFFSIFVIFIGLVFLGLGHGLILLPVLLSIIGPVESGSNIHPETDPVGKEVAEKAMNSTDASRNDAV